MTDQEDREEYLKRLADDERLKFCVDIFINVVILVGAFWLIYSIWGRP